MAIKKGYDDSGSGEILVCFNEALDLGGFGARIDEVDIEGIARSLGKHLGYEPAMEDGGKWRNWRDCHDIYIFRVPAGKEDEACRRFEQYPGIVQYAETRDLKMEARCDQIDDMIALLDGELRDLAERCVSDKKYRAKLEEICKSALGMAP
jgi:hypothetical protein